MKTNSGDLSCEKKLLWPFFIKTLLLVLLTSLFYESLAQNQLRKRIINIPGWNSGLGDYSAENTFLNSGDTAYFAFRKASDQGIFCVKLDSSSNLIDAKELRIPENLQHTQGRFHVKDVLEYRNFIYLITVSTYNRSRVLLKLDFELNAIWSKSINNASINNSLIGIGNHIYFTGHGYDGSVHRVSLDGSSIFSRKIPNASSQFLWDVQIGATHSTQILRSGNDIIYISCVNYPLNGDHYSHLLLMKLDTNFNVLTQKDIALSPDEYFELGNVGQLSLNNSFYVECRRAGLTEFMTLVFDNSLNMIRSKHWFASSVEHLPEDYRFHNRFCFGNECFHIYEYLHWYSNRPDRYYDRLIIKNSFYTNFHSYTNYKVPMTNPSGNRLHNGVDIIGMSKNSRTYSLFQIQDYNARNLGYDCSDCFLEIMEIESDLSAMACTNLDPVLADSAFPQTFVESTPNFYTVNIPSSISERPLVEAFHSTNQTQVCGPSYDTCGVLYARILEDSLELCAGQFGEFHVLTREAENYAWYLDNQLVDSDSVFGQTYTSPGAYNVKVVVNPGNGLSCTYSDSTIVIVRPLPDNILNDTLICKGDTTQLNVTGMQRLRWAPSTGLSCDTCFNPTVVLQDSQRYLLNAVSQYGCWAISNVNINVYPKPDASISGSNTICPGVTDVWFGLNPLDSFVATWWIDTIGIITQDFGDSIYTTWPQGIDSAFVYAYVQYPAGCEGDTIRFKVKVNRLLEPKIRVEDDSICFNEREGVTYELSYNTNGSIYLWEIENGSILRGDSTSRIIVNWDSIGRGKLIVREYSTTSIDTCFGLDSLLVVILPSPSNELMLTGNENACLEQCSEYSITPAWSNSSYSWSVGGANPFNGQGNAAIDVQWDNLGDFYVTVNEISDQGCPGPTDSLSVIVHPLPEPQRVGDDTLLCLDQLGNQRYEVSGFGSSSFNWSIEGGSIRNGQGSNSVNVSWDSSLVKSLKVHEISEFGCESAGLEIKQYFDLSRLELFVVTVNEDSSISLNFQIESLGTYPGDSVWVARRSEVPNISSWERIDQIDKNSSGYSDRTVNPNDNSYGYRIEGLNTCEQEIVSRDHASILLAAEKRLEDQNRESIELNWTPYRNWDQGLDKYELYELFDSTLVKVAESQRPEFEYDPVLPKKEHCLKIRALERESGSESWSNTVCIELERGLYIPNVVTPNGDGKNDKLQVSNLEVWPDHRLIIYNRWGQDVFETSNYNNQWPENSTISGTYFYRLQIRDSETGIEQNYKGWVQVLK